MSVNGEPSWQCGRNVLTFIPQELGAGLRVKVPWPPHQEEPVSTWAVFDLPMDAATMQDVANELAYDAFCLEETAEQEWRRK